MTLIIFIIVLAVLVLVHEWGHFFAARRFRVRVDEFGFGFPPRLASFKKGETRYSINAVPLGGFVRIKGEDGDAAGDQDSFAHKKIWQRVVILAAGVGMNFVLAIFIFMIGFGFGLPRVLENLGYGARVREAKVDIVAVAPNSPAAEAGVVGGETLAAIDDVRADKADTFRQYIREQNGKEVVVTLKQNGGWRQVAITPRPLSGGDHAALGVVLVEVGIVSYPWYLLPWIGVRETALLTWETLRAVGSILIDLIQRRPVTEELTGPVGVAVITARVARLGFEYLVQLVALLSINLAIINILPIPALDGGRVLFTVIEKLRGRPVRARVERTVHTIGFVVLLALILLITYRDILRLIAG